MRHGVEAVCQVAAHTLGGRVGIVEFGMRGFEFLEFAQERIVLEVAHFGRRFDIVFVVERVEFFAQLFYFLLHTVWSKNCSVKVRILGEKNSHLGQEKTRKTKKVINNRTE